MSVCNRCNKCNFRIKQEPSSVPTEIIIMTKPLLMGDGLDHLQATFGHIKVKKLSKFYYRGLNSSNTHHWFATWQLWTQRCATFQVQVANWNCSLRNKQSVYSKQVASVQKRIAGDSFMTILMLWHIKWGLSLFHLV